ncbi:MAG: gliding motility protein GldL [Crocinitomicaceae bacterium]
MSSSGGGIFASKKFKTIMKFVYGWGGAIVIIGAMFKIQHWPGATIMLIGGLGIEAGIFILSAFEPLHEDPNWELVYPELALGHSDSLDLEEGEEGHEIEHKSQNDSGSGLTQELDKMLHEANIDNELLTRLGDGMRSLGENAAQLNGMSSAASATDSYVNSLQAASDKVSSLSDAYERASVSIAGMTSNTLEGESFGEQMQKVSKNLAALNNVYELQLKGSSAHLETTEKFQSQVTEMMKNLSDSTEDTKRYKDNMAMLSRNLTDLNNVYGNMLKAMTINKGE